jgi:hypothetical protein
MSAVMASSPGVQPAAKGKVARSGKARKPLVGSQASREAKKSAAAILEVLAGGRTPVQAAEALGVSLPRYYVLEERALEGLVHACEPRPKGKVISAESQRQKLERECQRWQRAFARQQALLRAAQRTIGLAAPPAANGPKKRKRRPVVRALQAANSLRQQEVAEPAAGPDGAQAAKVNS